MIHFQADTIQTGKRLSDDSYWAKFETGETQKEPLAELFKYEKEDGIHVVVFNDQEWGVVKGEIEK